jgi:26S proteasome regulatory subunit N3
MGEIPSRQVFNTAEYQKHLSPYFQIVQCAKSGDMEKFRQLITQYQKVFQADKNLTLVQRLRHTVIKFGLKKINISYSKISIPDIKKRLGLDSVEETEHIVAKAIRDGVIDAVLNHDKQWMESLPITDVYASNDPQIMLDKRIRFCMDLHNDAIKGL